jgi:uncharacterized protein
MLTDVMKRIIQENTIGLVATVTPDGAPAVSPKATMVILDDTHIAFSDIRSPGTARNIKANPAVELNFIDVFRRQACRVKGVAVYHAKGEDGFNALAHHFTPWENLADRIRGYFVVEVTKAQHILSPAYDAGADEEALKEEWLGKYTALIGSD